MPSKVPSKPRKRSRSCAKTTEETKEDRKRSKNRRLDNVDNSQVRATIKAIKKSEAEEREKSRYGRSTSAGQRFIAIFELQFWWRKHQGIAVKVEDKARVQRLEIEFEEILDLKGNFLAFLINVSQYNTSWKMLRSLEEFQRLHQSVREKYPRCTKFPSRNTAMFWTISNEVFVKRVKKWTMALLNSEMDPNTYQEVQQFFDFANVIRFAEMNDMIALRAISEKKFVGSIVKGRSSGDLQYASKGIACENKDPIGIPYRVGPSARFYLVLINPFSGTKQAVTEVEKVVKPVFRAFGIHAEYIITQRAGHATDIAQHLDLAEYDVIYCVGGDGLLSEVFQGLAKHKERKRAISHPVAICPCGSGNTLAANLGFKNTFEATRAAAMGFGHKIDLFRFVQNEEEQIGFVWAGWGVIACVDFYSEWARFLGGLRFDLQGVLETLVKGAQHQCKVTFKRKGQTVEECKQGPFEIVMGLNVPLLDKNTRMSKTQTIDSGHLELVLSKVGKRLNMVKALQGLGDASFLEMDGVESIAVDMFTISPSEDCEGPPVDLDGERCPVEPFTVHCLAGRGCLVY